MAKIKIYNGSEWVEMLKASDISSWAKASSKPTYTYSEVGAAAASHTHTKSQITDFPATYKTHNIYMYSSTLVVSFTIRTTATTAYTSYSEVLTALYNLGANSADALIPAHGMVSISGKTRLLTGIYAVAANSTVLGHSYIDIATTSSSTMTVNTAPVYGTNGSSFGSVTVKDFVTD